MSLEKYFDEIAQEFNSYYEEPISRWQKLTNHYFRKPLITKRLDLVFQELNKRPHQSILDVGCGSGVLAVPLTQHGHQVVGLDFSAAMIELAKVKAKKAGVKVDFRVGDFMTEPLPVFDACAALGVMEYFKEPKPLIKKMLQYTRAGGIIIFDLASLFNYCTPLRLPYLLWRKQRAYFYTTPNIHKLIQQFESQIKNSRLHHYGAGYVVILEKK